MEKPPVVSDNLFEPVGSREPTSKWRAVETDLTIVLGESTAPEEHTIMKPALTAEEWERALAIPAPLAGVRVAKLLWHGEPVIPSEPSQRLHALAALALYGQPFGFTKEDVKQARDGASAIQSRHAEFCSGNKCSCYADARALDSVADRIEALLPSE